MALTALGVFGSKAEAVLALNNQIEPELERCRLVTTDYQRSVSVAYNAWRCEPYQRLHEESTQSLVRYQATKLDLVAKESVQDYMTTHE